MSAVRVTSLEISKVIAMFIFSSYFFFFISSLVHSFARIYAVVFHEIQSYMFLGNKLMFSKFKWALKYSAYIIKHNISELSICETAKVEATFLQKLYSD